jgi:DNA-binding response OmpR family regulator
MASSEHLPQECVTTHRWAVLVVEDEILVRLMIAHYLRAASYVVVEAANATEASSRFSRPATRWTSSLLMSGCPAQWTESCSHTGSMSIIPVYMCWSPPEMAMPAVYSGLIPDDTFFSKPYAVEEVADRIRSLLEDCRN